MDAKLSPGLLAESSSMSECTLGDYTLTSKYDGLPLPATEKGGDKKKKKKEEKKKNKEVKSVSDRLKLNMANERTFNKWLLTGMQMGAIGTFVLLTLDRRSNTIWGVATLAFAWMVGFAVALYGLYGYYGRRRALQSGDLTTDPAMGRSWVPCIVMLGLVAVVVTSLLYVGIAGLPSQTSVVSPHGHR